MSTWDLFRALPAALAIPLALAFAVPLLVLAVWMLARRRRHRSLADPVAILTSVIVSMTIALGILTSSLGIVQAGTDVVRPSLDVMALDLAADAERVWPNRDADTRELRPLLAVFRAAHAQVAWLAIARLGCTTGCLVTSDGVAADEGRRLAERVKSWANASAVHVQRIGGQPAVTARAAIRGVDGRPHAIAIVALEIRAAAVLAARNAWRLLLAELGLFVLAWFSVQRLLEVRVSDRIRKLSDRLAEQGPASSAPRHTPENELAELTERVDASVRQHAALESELQRARRLEAVGRLSGGVAHDFNNLLTIILGNTGLLRGEGSREELDAIDTAARRGATLVRKLLAFGRSEPLLPRPEPIGPLVHDVMSTVRRILPESIDVAVHTEVPGVVVGVDRTAFEQIVMNLATNAGDAMPMGGRFSLRVDMAPLPAAGAAVLEVPAGQLFAAMSFSDTGTGMTADTVTRAFEPFFTTKRPNQGSGLGLAIVHGLARGHEGWVDIASRPGEGTTVTVYLPQASASLALAPPISRGEVASATLHGTHRLLLVEDDDGVRMVTAQALKALGYEVDLAEEGATALRCLAGERPYDAVVTDVRMPVMGGLELVRAMRANGDLTPVLLVSGYSIEDVAAFCRSQPHIRSLGKPWSPQELNDAVEALIATAAPPSEFASPKVSLIR